MLSLLLVFIQFLLLCILCLFDIGLIENYGIKIRQEAFQKSFFLLIIQAIKSLQLLFVNKPNQIQALRTVLLLTLICALMIQPIDIGLINKFIPKLISQLFSQYMHCQPFTIENLDYIIFYILLFRVFFLSGQLYASINKFLFLRFIICLGQDMFIEAFILCLLRRFNFHLLLFKCVVLKLRNFQSSFSQLWQSLCLSFGKLSIQQCIKLLNLFNIQHVVFLNTFFLFLKLVIQHGFFLSSGCFLSFLGNTLRIFISQYILEVTYRHFLRASLLLLHQFVQNYKFSISFNAGLIFLIFSKSRFQLFFSLIAIECTNVNKTILSIQELMITLIIPIKSQ